MWKRGQYGKTVLGTLRRTFMWKRGQSPFSHLGEMKDYPDRMTVEEAKVFQTEVLNIVSQIPRGKVTTYGNVAALAGWPSHSRMVGRTLRYTPGAELLPCHRIVNKEGRTAPGWSEHRPLLEAEGVTFKSNGHVDMQRHLWHPEIM